MNRKEEQEVRRKLKILNHAKETRNVSKTCRYWGISRDTFYRWKKDYAAKGEAGLINSKPCPENPAVRVDPIIEEKILYLRKNYHFGQAKISWYLERYHGLKVSISGVYSVFCRHGLNRLPQNLRTRQVKSVKRYEKQVPGHHVQVDVKFLTFKDKSGKKVRRFQYTAIDDATRIRALKVYEKHNQACAIDFIDYVVDKFPFRIKMIRTDNGHEFQSRFHWHCEDLGMQHVYIKPASPNLNGKVERSHLTDKREFYQLLNYKGDTDLEAKLAEWEAFYNYHRPHGGLKGKTPYEILVSKMRA
ncbi:IS481 family transposase [Pseudoalteromonas ruthenica]|uniref:IS481 family transposase n=1 Tax=Pseudoalteromonas ruthenica TaxID=151081 RepID=UPI001109EAC8|nr:IS481 family transposase [Pseudoalteromonas ruthenica]TLX49231.1 IS481 family transposase [Pseudoalteromonas ruthenica]